MYKKLKLYKFILSYLSHVNIGFQGQERVLFW